MGIEYIRSAAGKPYRKRWKTGLNRLKSPYLFDIPITQETLTVTARLAPGCQPNVGEEYLVQTGDKGQLQVFRGHRQVAFIENPPSNFTTLFEACSGMLPVTVERVGGFGDTAELRVK
jgi:hypothetical protein